jgi:hypothetical protein
VGASKPVLFGEEVSDIANHNEIFQAQTSPNFTEIKKFGHFGSRKNYPPLGG